MEIILRLYLLVYDPLRPVVCFDERPCFLIGDRVEGIEMKKGSPAKENYSYTKHGSCSILAAIEPKTGQRLAHVRRYRTKKEFAIFMQNLSKTYPKAEKITVVLDNLNTHTPNSFYQVFDAQTAEELTRRFEFVYTPKSASWLNMIEIEFSALARQCLNKRIPKINQLSKEVTSYFKQRMENKIVIKWQFSCEIARNKLNRHYTAVNSQNKKYEIIN